MKDWARYGITFYDSATEKFLLLNQDGPYDGWVSYKHPDGQWVTLYKATKEDLARIWHQASKRPKFPRRRPPNEVKLRIALERVLGRLDVTRAGDTCEEGRSDKRLIAIGRELLQADD